MVTQRCPSSWRICLACVLAELSPGGSRGVQGTVTLIGPGVPKPCGSISFLTAKPPNYRRSHAAALNDSRELGQGDCPSTPPRPLDPPRPPRNQPLATAGFLARPQAPQGRRTGLPPEMSRVGGKVTRGFASLHPGPVLRLPLRDPDGGWRRSAKTGSVPLRPILLGARRSGPR